MEDPQSKERETAGFFFVNLGDKITGLKTAEILSKVFFLAIMSLIKKSGLFGLLGVVATMRSYNILIIFLLEIVLEL